jgi:hypothetical protein
MWAKEDIMLRWRLPQNALQRPKHLQATRRRGNDE